MAATGDAIWRMCLNVVEPSPESNITEKWKIMKVDSCPLGLEIWSFLVTLTEHIIVWWANSDGEGRKWTGKALHIFPGAFLSINQSSKMQWEFGRDIALKQVFMFKVEQVAADSWMYGNRWVGKKKLMIQERGRSKHEENISLWNTNHS